MSKSIKLQDNIYLDSTGIVHNQNVLSNILENINTLLTGLTTFSTSEMNTGRKWIDGKTIYKKTLSFDTSGTSCGVLLGVSNLSTVVDIYGTVKNGTDWCILGKGHPNTFNYQIGCYITPQNSDYKVNIEKGSGVSNGHAYVTVEYTKN